MKIVVIGASKGGTAALKVVLGELSAAFPLPIAVVLHRSSKGGRFVRQDAWSGDAA